MNEAVRCDRISLMHAGRVLATRHAGRPDRGARRRDPGGGLHRLHRGGRRARRAPASDAAVTAGEARRPASSRRGAPAGRAFSLRSGCSPTRSARSLELLRDPIRLGFALARLGVADAGVRLRHHDRRRQSASPPSTATRRQRAAPISRSCAARPTSSRQPPLADYADLEKRLKSGEHQRWRSRSRRASAATSRAGGRPWVGAWVDGAMPFRARDHPRLSAGHAPAVSRRSRACKTTRPHAAPPADIEIRFIYNQTSRASTRWCRATTRCCWC